MAAVPTLTAEIGFTGNPTATYADIASTADDAVSFWRCNSTSTFLDTLGANNGTMVSTPTLVAGPFAYDSDQATAFDGTNDSAYVPTSTSLSSKGNFTIEGWVSLPSYPASTKDLIAKRGAWLVQITSTGKIVFTLKDDTSTATVTSSSSLTTSTYYLVSCVYDSVNVGIYINGVLDNSTAYTAGWESGYQPIRFSGSVSTASPTWQSSQTATGSSATPTVTTPVSVATGDMLIAHIAWVGTQSVSTVPTGWTSLISLLSGASSSIRVYYKIATGSEPANYQWTLSGSAAWTGAVSRFTGCSAEAPFSNPAYGVTTASGTVHATGTHIPNTDNNTVLGMFSVHLGGASFTESSGTERYDVTAGSNIALAMCTQTQSSATSLSITGTSSGSQVGTAVMLVLCGAGVDEMAATLDDVVFWNKALSTDEMRSHYYAKDSGEGSYTNVSTSVRNFSTSGPRRQYELDRMEASTSDVLLRDFGHDFDPGDSTSIYYPNVIPVRRLRIRATWNSTTYDVLKEFIERWPPQGGEAVDYQDIAVTSVNGFDLISRAKVTGIIPVGYSGAQINALLDKAFWPVADRSIDTGQYVMAAFDLGAGADALASIQDVSDSERGLFFISPSGIATFHDAAHRGSQTRSTTSQATFADTTSSTAIIYQDLSPSADKDRIINDWTVSPDSTAFGSAAQRVTDWESVAKYGLRSATRSTRLASNASALDQAGNLLNETAGFGLRFDSMTVIPTTTAGYDSCFGLRIGDRVTVKRGVATKWTGAVIQKDCFVEGKSVVVENNRAPWKFVFSLSPVSLGNYYATILRDVPISYWRMDTIT